MSFGFLGIQFGWGLQLGNMSGIYEKLGAKPDELPLLWLAAPLTGLIIQPIIGAMSDRTWNRFGRRRPYFLVGAILSSLALFIMPTSGTLWMAAGLLWVLDASINVTMEPFRAFVADKLNDEQRTTGFVMQSFFIGLGASLAGWLPLGFSYLGVKGNTEGGIPLTIKYAFQLGAVAFLLAVLYTIFTTKEYPPENLEQFLEKKRASGGFFGVVSEVVAEISEALRALPKTMLQLAPVQIFTWLGLFCMWLFYVPAVARHVFGAVDPKSEAYTHGQEFGGSTFAYMNIVCFAIAFAIPVIAGKIGKKATHAICLTCGAIGLLSVYFISNPNYLIGSMCLIGVAWSSILSMPYAILSGALPAARIGVYMGVFNFFIVIPEIIQALTFGPIIRRLFGMDNPNSPLYMVIAGGGFMLLAAILTLFLVKDVSGAVPQSDVILADEKEPLTTPQGAQPVPSSGLID